MSNIGGQIALFSLAAPTKAMSHKFYTHAILKALLLNGAPDNYRRIKYRLDGESSSSGSVYHSYWLNAPSHGLLIAPPAYNTRVQS